jgi:hypothetical protein
VEHAVLLRARPILVVDAQDRERRHQQLEDLPRLAVRDRRLLHQLEREERAVREHLRLQHATRQLDHRGQLREAVAAVARRAAEHAQIQHRHVRVGVADHRDARLVPVERAQHDARGAERAGREHERRRDVRLDDAVLARDVDLHLVAVLAERLDDPAVQVRERRRLQQLVERPLRAVDAAVHVGPVVQVEVAVRAAAAVLARADREPRATHVEALRVQVGALPLVAAEDRLGVHVDVERRHHRRAHRKKRSRSSPGPQTPIRSAPRRSAAAWRRR